MEKVPIDVPDDMLKFAILAAIHAFGSSDVRNAPEISTQAIREIVEAVLDWQKAHAPTPEDPSSANRKQELLRLFLPYHVELDETFGGWILRELNFFLNDDGVRAVAKVLKMARDGDVYEFLWPQKKAPSWWSWGVGYARNKLTRGVPPVRRSTFIPKDQVETFARDEPKVSFTVNGIDDPPEALSGNYAGRDKSVPIYTPTEIDLHAVPIEIKDIISWFMVYFGDSPEIENMKRNVILAFMRGFEAAM